jgi:hypothetical protein
MLNIKLKSQRRVRVETIILKEISLCPMKEIPSRESYYKILMTRVQSGIKMITLWISR